MTRESAGRALILATTLIGLIHPLEAQARFEAGPIIGLYQPLGSYRPATYYSTGLPNSPGDLAGPALGMQGRYWMGRVGVQLDGAVAFSSVGGGATPGGFKATTSARVYSGGAQLLYDLVNSGGPRRLWLGVGGGVVHHGGEAYAPYRGRTRVAGLFGLGSTIPLGSGVGLHAGLTSMLYDEGIRDAQGTPMERGLQFDTRVETGVSWTFQ